MLTWIEVDSKAIEFNLRQFKKMIGKNRLLMPVIKANAYGHGFLEVAKILDNNKNVDRICVANLDEAVKLIDNNIKKQIMILSFFEFEEEKIIKVIKNKIIFPIYSLDYARKLNKVGERLNKKVKIHIKVDTGASRIGILEKNAFQFISKIKQFKNLEVEGMFSHFASSEDNLQYTKKQKQIFDKIILKLEKEGINIPIKHMACSASSVLYPDTYFNAVRLGLSLYGLHSTAKSKDKIELKPVLSWYTKIIQIKEVPVDTKIGYGGTYTTKKTTKIGILSVGYWDGYDRGLSNKSKVLVNGKKCPVLGRICMNLCMINLNGVKDVKTGNRVTLLGGDKKNNISITAEDLAGWANTINYEIVDRINPLLPRILK